MLSISIFFQKLSLLKNRQVRQLFYSFKSEKHFDKNPKVYCLTPSKRIFPYGVPKMNIYQNTNIIISVVPPGGFYNVERKPNDLRIDKNLNYGFAVRFVFKMVNLSCICVFKHFKL